MAYASAADMIERYDESLLKDLCSDDGTPATDLNTDRKLSTAIAGASGRVNAACQVGRLYSQDTLLVLAGDAAALLKDVVCGLAMTRLFGRRPMDQDRRAGYSAQLEEWEDYLTKLRNGERIFDVAENLAASTPAVEGPTMLEQQNLNLVTSRMRGYYPARSKSLPLDRGGG
jgi:phage gp36-like protein